MMDAGIDAGVDAGMRDAGVVDAGVRDAGMMAFDAGPPPPQTASGSMTVNGVNYMLTGGFATLTMNSLQLRLLSPTVDPQIQISIVVPASVTAGSAQLCSGPDPILFSGQWRVNNRIAFFTLNQTCDVRVSQIAADIGDDYAGTFSGTAEFDTRSALDPGFNVMTITNGNFTVQRF